MSKGLSSVKTLTAKEIANKWNLPLVVVSKKIAAGVKVEKEHTKSTRQANEIARDHLGERPDYYDKLGQMEKKKVKIKENTSVTGVAGLGFNTGVPAIDDDNEYITTNALARDSMNGAIMDFVNKHHQHLHSKTDFKHYDPKKIKMSSNKDLAESLGSDYGTAAVPVTGDLTGSPRKVAKIDEVNLKKITDKISPKVKKKIKNVAAATALASNAIAGAGAFQNASMQQGSPTSDAVNAAAGLPGKVGYAFFAGKSAKSGFDMAKEHIRSKQKLKEDLRKWFREKWVRYDTKGNIKGPCARDEGEGKPKCRPLASARAMSKDERAKSARRKRREDPVADRPGKGGKPVMVRTEETLMEKNVPTNPALWARAKSQARAKFDVYPSAYANGWAAKWYKSKGGGWKTAANESIEEACWDTHKQVGMKKKGNRMVPDCVPKEEKSIVPANTTERGIYEDAMKNAEDKIKAAFTADKVKGMFKRVDKQRDKDPKWVAYKKRKQQSIKEQLMTAKLGGRVPMDDPHTVTPSDKPGPRTPSDPPGPRTPSDPPGPITPDDSRNRNNISEMETRPLPTSRNIDDRRPGFNFQGLKQLTVDKFNKNMADRQAGDHYEFQKSEYNPNTSVKNYSDPQKPMDAAIGAVKDTVKQAGSYIKDRLGVDGKPFPSSYSAANRFNHPSYKPLQKVAQTPSQSMAASLPSGGGKTPATLGSANTPNKNDSKPFDWDDINGEKAAEVKRQNVSKNPGPTVSAAGEGSSGGGGRSITSNPTGWNVSQGADGNKMIDDKIDSRYTRTPKTTGDETPSIAKPTSSISPKRNELNEIKAATVGRAIAKAAAERKELTSKKMGKEEIAKWWKRERLVRAGVNKLTGKSKVPASTEESWTPFFPPHHKHSARLSKEKSNKPDIIMDPGAGGTTKTIYEDGMDYDAVVNAVRSKESRNDYGAKSKSSSASGAYQYINKTWRGSASKYGVDTKQYPTAKSAPKEVQDKVFGNDLMRNAQKYGGLDKAVNVHYTGNPAGRVSSAGLRANRGQTGSGYLNDIKKRVDDYNTERKSTMSAAQQMASNFSGGRNLTTPDNTQMAKAPEPPKIPETPKTPEPPKQTASLPGDEASSFVKKQLKISEETTMDTKDIINEALDDILENNLVAMKENFMLALQEKAMEKLEERKKIIASEYFAQ